MKDLKLEFTYSQKRINSKELIKKYFISYKGMKISKLYEREGCAKKYLKKITKEELLKYDKYIADNEKFEKFQDLKDWGSNQETCEFLEKRRDNTIYNQIIYHCKYYNNFCNISKCPKLNRN